ncbi:MAG TPA: hypothetical protein VLC28_15685 [Flavitalea sp.]|nr:hypothetical protein [Flavitalea sp.]
MNRFFLLLVITLTVYACKQPNNKTAESKEVAPVKPSTADSGFVVVKTSKLLTAHSLKPFDAKNRNPTDFALDKKSIQKKSADFIVKISDTKVLICDPNNKTLKELSVIKHWTKKPGPSTIYDLKDSNDIEYSLDHMVDSIKDNYFAFRFKDSLVTYSTE